MPVTTTKPAAYLAAIADLEAGIAAQIAAVLAASSEAR